MSVMKGCSEKPASENLSHVNINYRTLNGGPGATPPSVLGLFMGSPTTPAMPPHPDPQRDLEIRTIWKLYTDYIGVIMGLYNRGSNFWVPPRGLGMN